MLGHSPGWMTGESLPRQRETERRLVAKWVCNFRRPAFSSRLLVCGPHEGEGPGIPAVRRLDAHASVQTSLWEFGIAVPMMVMSSISSLFVALLIEGQGSRKIG